VSRWIRALSETGLDYFGARYFSGGQGRFTSPDPLLNSGRPDDPQSWNRYAYVGNNPLRYVDPLGLYKFATTCADDDTACKDQQQQFVVGLKALREAANNLEKGSNERKGIERALKKIGEKEGKGATIAFGFAGETNGTANLAIANPFSNTITFNMDAIGNFTKSNPVIQSGEATAGGFFTAVIGH
jgi:RHS repeat-associated protein